MASSSVDVPFDIQSRISAFEALSTKTSPKPGSSFSPPPNLLDAPISPSASIILPISSAAPSPKPKPIQYTRSPSPSPPILGRKTSLIDLKDWELDDGPVYNVSYATRNKSSPSVSGSSSSASASAQSGRPNPRHVSDTKLSTYSSQSTPLIHLESSPPKPKPTFAPPPPLPPRKASYGSLKSVSNSSTSSLARSPSGPANMALPLVPPRRKSDSLGVDTYAPPGKLGITIPRPGHAPASSISSFHSVSLSSDGGTDVGSVSSSHLATFPMDRDGSDADDHRESNGRDIDDVSLDSYENISTVSPSVSSISMDWGGMSDLTTTTKRPQPPKLPQRPPAKTPSGSHPRSPPAHPSSTLPPPAHPSSPAPPRTPLLTQPNAAGKPPPPPPPSRTRPPPASNRSSLASTITSASDYSILSAATSRTSLSGSSSVVRPPSTPKPVSSALLQQKLTRPTPIPPSARVRYEGVFAGNVLAQRKFAKERREKEREKEKERKMTLSPPPMPGMRKSRQAAGWRGLSVDLITNPEHTQGENGNGAGSPGGEAEEREDEGGEEGEERLDGRTVGRIWKASRLEQAKLKEIWMECDPTNSGSLDKVAFVKGMWRIDEELRRAQLTRRHPAATPRRKPSKPILR
ncbi:hypothetical protein EIP91_000303 [Steccherinum ochraceum]|uniref:EH domain-containing protein n=1 Tax=Steccherinum ochraceum TaxID=92696 RepID=A0A4R0RGA9_9APHY|nr:hypothetical protein EIP91_000303 [Steccherinum ochraceum]